MIKVKSKGDWDRTEKFFKKSIKITKINDLTTFAEKCVEKLKAVTPKDSGITADSWGYTISKTKYKNTLSLINTNIQNGTKIVLLLEFGHATVDGRWVEGKNFIGPVTQEVYNEILNDAWKELKRL